MRRHHDAVMRSRAPTGYRQVTDAHLLALAIRHGGALVTFDRGLNELAGSDGRDALEVIRFKLPLGD